MPEIMTRREAHAKGLVRYSTGRPCQRGHLSERYVSTGGCIACVEMFRTPQNGRQSGLTKDIVTWLPPRPFWVPAGFTYSGGIQLQAYLRQCTLHWLRSQSMVTAENELAYGKHEADEQQKDRLALAGAPT